MHKSQTWIDPEERAYPNGERDDHKRRGVPGRAVQLGRPAAVHRGPGILRGRGMIMRKADIVFHRTGYYGPSTPAVNVKNYNATSDADIAAVAREFPGFSRADIDALSDKERSDWYSGACEAGWETLNERARAIWGDHARVYAEGRSDGWAVVSLHDRLLTVDDVSGWNAIDVARWSRFAREAKAVADDIPYQYAWTIAANVYEPERERLAYQADPQRQIEI